MPCVSPAAKCRGHYFGVVTLPLFHSLHLSLSLLLSTFHYLSFSPSLPFIPPFYHHPSPSMFLSFSLFSTFLSQSLFHFLSLPLSVHRSLSLFSFPLSPSLPLSLSPSLPLSCRLYSK